jgi:hypothetical protein
MKRYITNFQILTIILLLSFAKMSVGQQAGNTVVIKPDARLYDCMDKAYVDGLQSNPRLLLYYNFYLDHSYYLSDIPDKKVDGIDISTVSLRNPGPQGEKLFFHEDPANIKAGTFNPLKYDFKTQANLFTNYLLGNTGKILVFYSDKAFTEKYKTYLKSFNLEAEK